MNFLLLLKIFNETRSTIATSFLWIMYALPAVFFGPIGSASVDMLNKKKLLMITNLFQSLVVLFYAFFYNRYRFLPYGIALAYSLLNQFYTPAELATLPSVVAKKDLALANGYSFMTQQLGLVIGFTMAGIFYNILGLTTSVVLCSVLLFIAFISVSFLPDSKNYDLVESKFENSLLSFFKKIIEGYSYVKTNTQILGSYIILILLQTSLAIVLVNAPKIAEQLFKVEMEYIGLYLVIPVGIGDAAAANLIPKLLNKGVQKIKITKAGLTGMTFNLFLIAFVLPSLGGVAKFIIDNVTLMGLGAFFICILIPSQTLLQENTPEKLRGRVFGNLWFVTTIFNIFPVLFSGAFTDVLGAQFIAFSLGVFFLVQLLLLQKRGLFIKGNLNI